MAKKENIKGKKKISLKDVCSDLCRAVKPLLSNEDVVKKWGPILPQYLTEDDFCKPSFFYDTANFFNYRTIDEKTIIKLFETTKKDITLFVGKALVKNEKNDVEFKELIFDMQKNLWMMNDICCNLGYDLYENPKGEDSYDFRKLVTAIKKALNFVSSIDEKIMPNINWRKYYCVSDDVKNEKHIDKLSSIYDTAVELSNDIAQLKPNDTLFGHKNTLRAFIINFSNAIFMAAGKIYTEQDTSEAIFLKARKTLRFYIDKLENLSPARRNFLYSILNLNNEDESDNIDEFTQNVINDYSSLKKIVYNMIFDVIK